VNELESKVNLFEFLNKDNRGFDSAIFSTFRESKEERTQRETTLAQVLFTDPRNNNELIPIAEDATVELVGERLILSTATGVFHTINNVRQIFDSESPQSEIVVEPADSSLLNTIDNTKGTYWIQQLLFATNKEYVKVKLELNLGSVKEINLIEIDPAVRHELILESISYIDSNNVANDLAIVERNIDASASIRVKKIATDRLILTFRNENSIRADFEYNPDARALTEYLGQKRKSEDSRAKRISGKEQLNELVASEKIKDLLRIKKAARSSYTGYAFVTGIDNIRVGTTRHEERSIYISSPLNICGIGELGLRTLESRPYIDAADGQTKFTDTTYDIDQDSSLTDDSSLSVGETSNVYFQGSIEYWVVRQDLDENGQLVRTTTFPILPLDIDRIYHERLVLNDKSDTSLTENDIGQAMFFANRTDGDIKVYRNGELIEDQTGFITTTDGWLDISETSDRTPNNGTSMALKIQVLERLPGDIFTISYTPSLSSTTSIPKVLSEFTQAGGLKVVDMAGDLSVRPSTGQLIILDRIGEDNTEQESNLYLVIILRQNTAESTLTPAVEEYTLLSGCKDLTKFEDV